MAEPTRQSLLVRGAKTLGVGLLADIAIVATGSVLWHLLSGKNTPLKGDVRVAIAKIVIPDLMTTGSAERQTNARARHEAALTKITEALAFINQQDEETIRDMNAARSTEDWTVIFTNVPAGQWVEYLPKQGSVPLSTWQQVSNTLDLKLPKTARAIHEAAEKRRQREQARAETRQNPPTGGEWLKAWIREHTKKEGE